MTRIPIVDYLVLDPEPSLRARECTDCGARFLGRRRAGDHGILLVVDGEEIIARDDL